MRSASVLATILPSNKSAAANPAEASQLQFTRSASRVAELGPSDYIRRT